MTHKLPPLAQRLRRAREAFELACETGGTPAEAAARSQHETTMARLDAAASARLSASEATTELLRFARDGVMSRNLPFGIDVVNELVDATRIAIRAELAFGQYTGPEEQDLITLLACLDDHAEVRP